MTGLAAKYQITCYHIIMIPVKYNKEVMSLAHDMSGLLAREMSAFHKRPAVDHLPGGRRDGLRQGRDGAGDEGTGSDFAGHQQADSLV